MFKLTHNTKGQTPVFHGRQLNHDIGKSGLDKHGRTSDFLLTNIIEEASSVDEPRNFEQEEQYLNECLRAASGSVEDVQCSEIEEYDFDDFNSIASTASLLNLADVKYDGRTKLPSYPPKGALRQPKPAPILNGTLPRPTQNGTNHYTNGYSVGLGKERVSSYQKSVSKVHDWDHLGRTANQEDWKQVLLRAAEAGDLITVQDAVSHLGAKKESLVHARDIAGNTPLHRAAQGGKLQCLQWLVKRAPAQAVAIGNNDGMTPAAMATQFGQCECLAWLVESTQAKEELETTHSFSLVHYAAQAGEEKCLTYLLTYLCKAKKTLDIRDSNAVSPAHLAAREGHLLCLQTLVDYNADVTSKDKDGWTAADYAFKSGQTGCAKYLAVVESCFALSERVASATRELTKCRQENTELRRKIEVLEDRSQTSLPSRPEAIGGDQSDNSSTTSAGSAQRSAPFPSRHRQPEPAELRASSPPDGESPKNTDNDGDSYDFQVNGYERPRLRDKSVTQHSGSGDPRRHTMPESLPQGHLSNERTSRPGSRPANGRGQSTSQVTNKTQRLLTITPAQTSSMKKSPPPPPPRSTSVSRTNIVARPKSASSLTTRSANPDDWRESRQRSNSAVDGGDSRLSSRSQSPYRSDRSTGSLVDTVLDVATPMPRTRENINRARDAQRNDSRDNRLLAVDRSRTQAGFSSESPFSSDSDVEHTYERRNSLREQAQVTASKDSLRKIRTEGLVPDDIDSPLRTSTPASQQARLSWHGVTRTGKIASLSARPTRDKGTSNRTPIRPQAEVTWNEQRTEKAVPPPVAPKPAKPVLRRNILSSPPSFSSAVDAGDHDKPWYEMDEVDL